jgi:hypothetical protein
MLSGSASVEALGELAPEVPSLQTASVTARGMEIVQAGFEYPYALRESLLPPGLHPTNPPMLTVLVYRCVDPAAASETSGTLGAFTMVQVRIECRSGMRSRGFLLGAYCDSEAAAVELATRWGYRTTVGRCELRRGYDRVAVSVTPAGSAGPPVLALELLDPMPLAPTDVQYVANMNLARTPAGLRLLQVEPEHTVSRAERALPRLTAWNGAAWGAPALQPGSPIAGSIAVGDITWPALRYVCRPDVLAFFGTEAAS